MLSVMIASLKGVQIEDQPNAGRHRTSLGGPRDGALSAPWRQAVLHPQCPMCSPAGKLCSAACPEFLLGFCHMLD